MTKRGVDTSTLALVRKRAVEHWQEAFHRFLHVATARGVRGRVLRRRLFEALWERELDSEVTFWKTWLMTEGLEWRDDFRERLDPASVLAHDVVVERLREIPAETISILDVGAGPLTILGKTFPRKVLNITPIDPLAEHYSHLLDSLNIDPPVRTTPGHGERLLELFEPKSFDIAFAHNSVDHSYDPVLVIRNMLQVIKDHGSVVLSHMRNEAENEGYSGLHQWNFDVRDGDLILWNRAVEHNVSEFLRASASVNAFLDGAEDSVVNCVLMRRNN